MGLFPLTESQSLTSPRTGTSQQKVETNTTFDNHLLKQSYTKNTFNNRTALNQNRLSPIIHSLGYFPTGYPIFVTYYSFTHNYSDKQSSVSDYKAIVDNVNVCYKKINNLEIRLNSEMDFSFLDDEGEIDVNGIGKIYPGFRPSVGDIFLYEVMPGKLGLFIITNIDPLSAHQGFQDTSFTLREFVSNETLNKIEDCVLETYYYDTVKSFGEKRIILNRADYLTFQNMINLRRDLINLYYELFYDKTLQTFTKRDGSYDGYVVNFMNLFTNFSDHYLYPAMQLINTRSFERSIWDIITNRFTNFKLVDFKHYKQVKNTKSVLDVHITGLVNRNLIILTKDETDPYYAFSENYYNSNQDTMTAIEQCVFTFTRTGTINPQTIETFITQIDMTNIDEYFYFFPVMIILINEILHSI